MCIHFRFLFKFFIIITIRWISPKNITKRSYSFCWWFMMYDKYQLFLEYDVFPVIYIHEYKIIVLELMLLLVNNQRISYILHRTIAKFKKTFIFKSK